MIDPLSIKITKDASTTIYHSKFNECYHSQHGAIQESLHVFIKNGLFTVQSSPLCIFEMGFGTGLNAYLTALHSTQPISYDCIELYPLSKELVSGLNYPQMLNGSEDLFHLLHDVSWNQFISITSQFELRKQHTDFSDLIFDRTYDLIYYDAFSPRIQEHLWDVSVFESLYDCLNSQGVFVTYCAKSSVRRALLSCGFTVEKLPGPPGKREMLRAIK